MVVYPVYCRCQHAPCCRHCRSAECSPPPGGPSVGWEKLHRRQNDQHLPLETDRVRGIIRNETVCALFMLVILVSIGAVNYYCVKFC